MAKTITEKNGHSSQPSKPQEIRNKARKNHNIMSRGDDGLKLPPRWLIQSALESISKKSHGKSTIDQQVWAVAIIKSVF